MEDSGRPRGSTDLRVGTAEARGAPTPGVPRRPAHKDPTGAGGRVQRDCVHQSISDGSQLKPRRLCSSSKLHVLCHNAPPRLSGCQPEEGNLPLRVHLPCPSRRAPLPRAPVLFAVGADVSRHPGHLLFCSSGRGDSRPMEQLHDRGSREGEEGKRTRPVQPRTLCQQRSATRGATRGTSLHVLLPPRGPAGQTTAPRAHRASTGRQGRGRRRRKSTISGGFAGRGYTRRPVHGRSSRLGKSVLDQDSTYMAPC